MMIFWKNQYIECMNTSLELVRSLYPVGKTFAESTYVLMAGALMLGVLISGLMCFEWPKGKAVVAVLFAGCLCRISYGKRVGEFAGQEILSDRDSITIPLAFATTLDEQVFKPHGVTLALSK